MKTIIQLILLTLAAVSGQAAAPSAAGHWQGAITLPGTRLEVAVDLKAPAQADQPWSGTIDIPAQMLRGFALAEVTVEGSRVAFKMPDIPGDPAFDGKMTDDGNRVVGDFRQNGQTFPFALNRGEATKRSGETPSHGVPGKGLAGTLAGLVASRGRAGGVASGLACHLRGRRGAQRHNR